MTVAIYEGLPDEVSSQLMSKEEVYYFSYISYKGGCGSSGARQNYWIALTNKRVLYKAKILEEKLKYVEKDGILPLDKISFVEVSEVKDTKGCGCSSAKVFQLRISSSGGTVIIPIPTKEKGYEIRKVYSEITEEMKTKWNGYLLVWSSFIKRCLNERILNVFTIHPAQTME